jgi:hypothetical protein
MTKLENITKGTYLNGVIPNQMVEVIDAVWHGTDVIEITFKDSLGNPNTISVKPSASNQPLNK